MNQENQMALCDERSAIFERMGIKHEKDLSGRNSEENRHHGH